MDIHEIVKKLIGEIDPAGDTNIDNKRYENLKTLIVLTDKLLIDIDRVAMQKDSHMYSVKTAGRLAHDFYTRLGIPE